MQFSYEVGEADYMTAVKLRGKAIAGQRTVKTVMFWMFILVCLLTLWSVVERNATSRSRPATTAITATHDDSVDETPPPPPVDFTRNLIVNVGPFVLLGGVWFFLLFRMGPGRLRKLYRNDSAMQGRFTVEISSQGIAVENTAGFTLRSGWNLYEFWTEGKDLVVLGLRSQGHFILAVSQLAPEQREELRSLLSSVLSKK